MSGLRDFVDLADKIAPSVPGCPTPTLIQYIRDIAIEVCEKTLVWRYEQPLIRLTAGVYEYDYEPPCDAEVCGVIHSAVNGVPVPFLVQEEVHRLYPDWPSTDSTKRAQPRFLTQFDPDHVLVVPIPDSATTYDLKMFLALRPKLDATDMDKTAMDEVEQVIIHGVLQHLLVMPKSWMDRELATYHAKQYTYKTASRRAKVNLGVGRGPLRVQMQPFG